MVSTYKYRVCLSWVNPCRWLVARGFFLDAVVDVDVFVRAEGLRRVAHLRRARAFRAHRHLVIVGVLLEVVGIRYQTMLRCDLQPVLAVFPDTLDQRLEFVREIAKRLQNKRLILQFSLRLKKRFANKGLTLIGNIQCVKLNLIIVQMC